MCGSITVSLDDVVVDQDRTFAEQYFKDLYDYLGIKKSMSTAVHPESDGQIKHINQVIESYL